MSPTRWLAVLVMLFPCPVVDDASGVIVRARIPLPILSMSILMGELQKSWQSAKGLSVGAWQ